MKLITALLMVSSFLGCSHKEHKEIDLDHEGDTVKITTYLGETKNGPTIWFAPNKKRSLVDLYSNDTLIKKTYFFESGRVKSEGSIKDFKPHGEWNHYYEQGSLRSSIEMSEGVPGQFTQYYLNGKIEMQGDDMNGNGIISKYDSSGLMIWKLKFQEGEIEDTLYISAFENN